MPLTLPPYVLAVLGALEQAGHSAFVVGGCVRDSLLGRAPQEWDVATSARPDQIRLALRDARVLETGPHRGTITVMIGGESVEITTYLAGEGQADINQGIRRDLSRRDFTVNALAYHEKTGLIDCFDGYQDLQRKRIRAVGEPDHRFQEDPLRILRALRFASTLGFSVEEQTAQSLHRNKRFLRNSASETVRDELSRLLCGEQVTPVLLAYADILSEILPEIEPSIGFDQQNYHHIYDVWEHTARSVGYVAPKLPLRLAMLLHDLGKPRSFTVDSDGIGHFYGHPMISTGMAGGALMRLRYDEGLIRQVCTLVEYHDSHVHPTESSVKRWLARLGEPHFRMLLAVKRADNLAQSPEYRQRQAELTETEIILDRIITENLCYSLDTMEITGDDLKALGATGLQTGSTLNALLQEVIAGRIPNHRGTLLSRAAELLNPRH